MFLGCSISCYAKVRNFMSTIYSELYRLSIVIPARDEEGCIASTVEHLHLELKLHGVAHEIIVVDDGSSDSTWKILQEESDKIPELKPICSPGPHGFGRAITRGLDAISGDAVEIYGGFEAPWESGYEQNINLFTDLPCSPCWLREPCPYDKECMQKIDVKSFLKSINAILSNK
jgi:glycosyltransferase involved in cell wall biosynthesis